MNEPHYTEALDLLVHPSWAREKNFLMVKSYWDESGIQDRDVMLMAGYFGGVNQWKTFDRRWKAILDREGIDEFHAKEFWATENGKRVGKYAGWSDERAKQFLDDLVGIARNVSVSPVGCAVVLSAWNQLTTDEQRWLTGARWEKHSEKMVETGVPSKPYFFCFQWCVFDAVKYCQPHIKMHGIFDLNQQFEPYSHIIWKAMKEEAPIFKRLGDVTFPTSETTPGLQLADLFAYRSKRHAAKKLKDPSVIQGELLNKLLYRLQDEKDFKFFDLEDLKSQLKTIPPYLESSQHDKMRPNDENEIAKGKTAGGNA